MLTNQLNEIIDGLGALSFEITLGLGAILLLLIGLMYRKTIAAQLMFVVVILAAMWLMPGLDESELAFGESMSFDALGGMMKLLFGFVSVWIVFFPTAKDHPTEYYFLTLSLILGSALMLSANHLLVIYLAVELTSFSAYLMTNFNFRKQSFEAGMKYLIFGGVSSALALYGASLIYGFTGTLTLSEMGLGLQDAPYLLNAGILLFSVALLFKISAVPFHIWVPSAYQEAPTDAVMILSVIPKIAGFVLLHRILWVVDMQHQYWLLMTMAVLGMATIAAGTLGAIRQTNAKRLMAYGAIAHSGLMMAALLISFSSGITAFAWYAVIYAFMNLAVFYLLSVMEQNGSTEISDFAGLYRTESYIGGLMVLVMIALIGLPPTAGFTAKFYLFTVIWEWYQSTSDTVMLTYLIVAVLSVVFSLFFYLKIPYYVFLKEGGANEAFLSSLSQRIIATIFTTVLLWLFFRPEILNNIADQLKSIDW